MDSYSAWHPYFPGVDLRSTGIGDDYRALARSRGGKVLHDPAIIEPHQYEYMAPAVYQDENATPAEHEKHLRHLRWIKKYAECGDEIRARKRLAYYAAKARKAAEGAV